MLEIKLNRDLKRTILQGHPWVFSDAIIAPEKSSMPQLCRVRDKRGEQLAWALYAPDSPLALRILSLEKGPPGDSYFQEKLTRAVNLRRRILSSQTNAVRLINGEGDRMPGVVCDLYHDIAVMQFDGPAARSFWEAEKLAQWLLELDICKTVIDKPRSGETQSLASYGVKLESDLVEISENGAKFLVDIVKGQKTGFFLDQRNNRQYLRQNCKGLKGLNLFSYSGGFSIYAGLGEAKSIASLDISKGALKLAEKNWALNDFDPSSHQIKCTDAFEFLATDKEKWDFILVDPPSLTHSEKQVELASKKYIEIFSAAAKNVNPGGDLYLSSCSGHINYDHFFSIIDQAISKSRRRAQILHVGGQGQDHPFPHIAHQFRYLKFVHLVLD